MAFGNFFRTAALCGALFFATGYSGLKAQSVKDSIVYERKDENGKKYDFYITGFGPFLDYDGDSKVDRNPTQDIIDYFKAKGYPAEVLEVDYNKSVGRLEEIVKKYKPKLVISMGVSDTREYIDFPIVALNNYYLDSCGFVKIDENLDDFILLETSRVNEISNFLDSAKILYKMTDYAGYSQCNYLLFNGIKVMMDNDIDFYFFHVPHDIYLDDKKFSNLKSAIELFIEKFGK